MLPELLPTKPARARPAAVLSLEPGTGLASILLCQPDAELSWGSVPVPCNLHRKPMAQVTQREPAKPSNFDTHKPPETALIEDCVHCGFCLPACPTYVLWGEEMDSPRGRIYMMKKSAQGEAPLDQRFRLHMDNCLGCMACMTACPSGVQYNKLIEDTRAQVERNIPRTPRIASSASFSSPPSLT